MGTYGTFTGVVRWFDPVTQIGYMMSLKDGEIQAAMIGDGLEAASGNILMDENGFTLHDMSGASIITPTFGVGAVHDTLPHSEDFTGWTAVGTASVTANTVVCPDGVTQIADTVALPAVNDEITQLAIASPTLADGQSAAFMIWLKAAAAGTVTLYVKAGSGEAVVGTETVAVTTEWRRFAVLFTNSTGSAFRALAGIKRSSSGELSSLYAWGAQCAYDVPGIVPYYPFEPGGNRLAGTLIRGPLFISSDITYSVIIGSNWTTLPVGDDNVYIGISAGNAATGQLNTAIGAYAAKSNSGNYITAIGYFAGGNNTDDSLTAVGESAGLNNSGAYATFLGNHAGYGNSGNYLVGIGESAARDNSGSYIIAIGREAGKDNVYGDVVLIGRLAAATGSGQIVFGSASEYYTELFVGGGVAQGTPPDFRLNATGGSGTNIAGGALKVAGGRGTGTGAGGSVVIQTAPAGSSGSSQNALVDRITVASDGSIDFHSNTITNWAGPGGTGTVYRWRTWFGA